MDLLSNCEDIVVSKSILRSLEDELVHDVGAYKAVHEVLNLGENPYITGLEVSPKVALGSLVCPPNLIGSIKHLGS